MSLSKGCQLPAGPTSGALLLVAALGVLSGLVVMEVYAWLKTVTGWLARQAAKFLLREEREEHLEQWLADLDTLPVSLVRFLRCIDLYRAAIALRCDDLVNAMAELRELLVMKFTLAFATKRMFYSIKLDRWMWRSLPELIASITAAICTKLIVSTGSRLFLSRGSESL